MASWFASAFGIDPGFARGVLFVFTAAILLAIVWAIIAFVRGLTSGRLSRARRNRQPRLAVMDTTDIDHRRQLVLVRRDHVEHLLLIGGPVDVVVEENIIRNAASDLYGRGSRRGHDATDIATADPDLPAEPVAPAAPAEAPSLQGAANPAARPNGNGAAPSPRAPVQPAPRAQPPGTADAAGAGRWRSTRPSGSDQDAAAGRAPLRPVAGKVPPAGATPARPQQPARPAQPPRPAPRAQSEDLAVAPQPAKIGPASETKPAPAFVPPSPAGEAKEAAAPAPAERPQVQTPPMPEATGGPATPPPAASPAPAAEAPVKEATEPKADDDLDLDDEMARLLRGVGER